MLISLFAMCPTNKSISPKTNSNKKKKRSTIMIIKFMVSDKAHIEINHSHISGKIDVWLVCGQETTLVHTRGHAWFDTGMSQLIPLYLDSPTSPPVLCNVQIAAKGMSFEYAAKIGSTSLLILLPPLPTTDETAAQKRAECSSEYRLLHSPLE